MTDKHMQDLTVADFLLRLNQANQQLGSGGESGGGAASDQMAAAAAQSAQLAAVLQSTYGMNPFGAQMAQLYNPYNAAAMYGFGNSTSQLAAAGGVNWPGMLPTSAEYMLNIAAWQNFQQSNLYSTATTESFADILKKMPQAPPTTDQELVDVRQRLRSNDSGDLHPLSSPQTSTGQSTSSLSGSAINHNSTARELCNSRNSSGSDVAHRSVVNDATDNAGTAWQTGEKQAASNLDTLAAVATSLNASPSFTSIGSAFGKSTSLTETSTTTHSGNLGRNSLTCEAKKENGSPEQGLEPGEIVLPLKKRPALNMSTSTNNSTGEPKAKLSRLDNHRNGSAEAEAALASQKAPSLADIEALMAGKLSSDVQIDPRLLNASAMAWATFSNQILLQLGMQGELLRQSARVNASQQHHSQSDDLPQPSPTSKTKQSAVELPVAASKSRSRNTNDHHHHGRSRSSRSRSNANAGDTSLLETTVASKCTMDDTIDSVIKQCQMMDDQAVQRLAPTLAALDGFNVPMTPSATTSARKKTSNSRRKPATTVVTTELSSSPTSAASTPLALTVREQLALRRAVNLDSTLAQDLLAPALALDQQDDSAPLDLSTKHSNRSTPVMAAKFPDNDQETHSGSSDTCGRSTESPSYPRKRRVAEEHLVRVPLTKGWHRQTCIRSISANGVRGDVMYYAPCGKKLGSYAEVIRYLTKHKIEGIGREHFSFSCKIIVGEFLQIRPENGKNGITRLSENDISELIQRLNKDGFPNKKTTVVENQRRRPGIDRSIKYARRAKNRLMTHNRRQVEQQQRQMLKSWELRKTEREREAQLRAQKVMEAMRRAKEQELKKQQQVAMLHKQGEEYYRHMLVMGLEREKWRQQLVAAKASENRKRQEERQRLYAEKLIRQEEKIAARNAQINRIKLMRQPTEDLDLDEDDEVKALPELDRIPGMGLSGQAFADLLMVMEFVQNFSHVLKIDPKLIPSLSDVQSGLLNDGRHLKASRDLTKTLLTLVLEYPGLPPGIQAKTYIGQSVKELKITRDNMSELLRMFLQSRDKAGKKLAEALFERSFEALEPDSKAAILAYMCNELLYCRNVVREIEGNIDDVARLKGEKWLKEGKLRSLRSLQARKRMEENRLRQADEKAQAEQKSVEMAKSGTSDIKTETDSNDKAPIASASKPISENIPNVKVEMEEFPNSPAESMESDASEHKTMAQVKQEELIRKKQQQQSQESQQNSEVKSEPCQLADGAPCKKLMPTNHNQPEVITEEEKKLSADALTSVIDQLSTEMNDMRFKICDLVNRVRVQPFGQDRYYRLYWALPHTKAMLVESMESACMGNPANNIEVATLISGVKRAKNIHLRMAENIAVESEVVQCLDSLLNLVCEGQSAVNKIESVLDLTNKPSSSTYSKTQSSKPDEKFGPLETSVPPEFQSSWWVVRNKKHLQEVQASFHNRGIRERVLARTLVKCEESIDRCAFQDDAKSLILEAVTNSNDTPEEEMDCIALRSVLKNIRDFESKVFLANVHCRQWRPLEPCASELQLDSGSSVDSDSEDTDNSKDSISAEIKNKPESIGAQQVVCLQGVTRVQLMETVKRRLILLEKHIERRYLQSPFHFSQSLPPTSVMNSVSQPGTPASFQGQPTAFPFDKEDSMADSNSCFPPDADSVLDSGSVASEASSGFVLNGLEKEKKPEEADEIPTGLLRWRDGVEGATNAAQLMLCLQQLDSNIAWEKSIMRASCQICHGVDNESELLLCDGCDMGYHTYCFKPKMSKIPEGDWFCPDCISRATEKPCCLICGKEGGTIRQCSECTHEFHLDCLVNPKPSAADISSSSFGSAATERQASESPSVASAAVQSPTCRKLQRGLSTSSSSSAVLQSSSVWTCAACSKNDAAAKVKKEPSAPQNSAQDSAPGKQRGCAKPPVRKASVTKIRSKMKLPPKESASSAAATPTPDKNAGTPISAKHSPLEVSEICSIMLAELEAHRDAWPFRLPVDTKAFPLYKKVIRKPMDMSVIQSKVSHNKYECLSQFSDDVKLILDNCKIFNEDDSPVGKAGYSLRRFFNRRWKEIRDQSAVPKRSSSNP